MSFPKGVTWREISLGVVGLVALFGVLTFLSDPLMWRRYAGGLEPGSNDVYPTVEVVNPTVYELPHASATSPTLSADAARAAIERAAALDADALIVVHKGAVQLEWYSDAAPPQLASQTMQRGVLALLVGAAIADGAIKSVDESIGTWIKDWARDARGKITIRQLLTMTSGLERRPFSHNPFSGNFRLYMASDTTAILLETRLKAEPGTIFEDNDVNAELLGLVIERATSKRYGDYLNEKLWAPLGNRPARLWVDRKGGRAHTSCCLFAVPMDWARIGTTLANRGTIYGNDIVRADWIDEMTSPSPLNPRYGYGVWLASPGAAEVPAGHAQAEPFLAGDAFYMAGGNAQRVYMVPSENLAVVLMAASPSGDWDNAALLNTIIRGLTRRTAQSLSVSTP